MCVSFFLNSFFLTWPVEEFDFFHRPCRCSCIIQSKRKVIFSGLLPVYVCLVHASVVSSAYHENLWFTLKNIAHSEKLPTFSKHDNRANATEHTTFKRCRSHKTFSDHSLICQPISFPSRSVKNHFLNRRYTTSVFWPNWPNDIASYLLCFFLYGRCDTCGVGEFARGNVGVKLPTPSHPWLRVICLLRYISYETLMDLFSGLWRTTHQYRKEEDVKLWLWLNCPSWRFRE